MQNILKRIDNKIFGELRRRGYLNFISDEKMLEILYLRVFHKKLNLAVPETFNEKLQWLKINDRKSEYTNMVDKYEAKKYVANIIGNEYIIPTLGIWKSFNDIDFDSLPNQFVLKCTHDSGGLIICRDKSKFNKKQARKKIEKSLKVNFYSVGREWQYKNVKPYIIAEQYMENFDGDKDSSSLMDYKFYCFNGKVRCLYASCGMDNHDTAKMSFLTPSWELAPFRRTDYKSFNTLPKKPSSFDKMIKLAECLSSNTKFLRVDLYEINDKIYFSELTFAPCSGLMPFEPKEWDKILGSWIDLNS